METILLNISCTCTNLFTYWTRKFILVRGRIASSFQLRFRVPTTIPYAPPFCGSGGAVELPTSSFYQLLCSPRILGLYLTIVWGYHLIHTDSVHDGPAGSILPTCTVMDQIRRTTYRTVLLNCGSYFVLDGDMFSKQDNGKRTKFWCEVMNCCESTELWFTGLNVKLFNVKQCQWQWSQL